MDFSIDISTAKKEIKQIILKIENLREFVHNHLENCNENISKNELDEIMIKIKKEQNDLDNLLIKYESSELQKSLKKKLNKRSKKRNKIKMKHKETIKRRMELHDKIDQSLLFKRKEFNEQLEKERSSKRANTILSKIHSKIGNAQWHIKQIKSFAKLADNQKQKNAIKEMLDLWEKNLMKYKKEETKTKKVLGYKSTSLEDQWIRTLFGETEYTRDIKHQKLCDFLEIRRTWDTYIMPSNSNYGTPIPSGWVLPPSIPSEQWSKYLFNENT